MNDDVANNHAHMSSLLSTNPDVKTFVEEYTVQEGEKVAVLAFLSSSSPGVTRKSGRSRMQG